MSAPASFFPDDVLDVSAGVTYDFCGAVEHLGWEIPGTHVVCCRPKDHSGSHEAVPPISGRRRVDLKPEYLRRDPRGADERDGAGAGSVHMRARVVWDEPDIKYSPSKDRCSSCD